jgi:hypothetical protein
MNGQSDFLVDAAVARDAKLKWCLGEIQEVMDRMKLDWDPQFVFTMGPLRIMVNIMPKPDSPLLLLDPVLGLSELEKAKQQIFQIIEAHDCIIDPLMIVGTKGHGFKLNVVLNPQRIVNSPIFTPGRN